VTTRHDRPPGDRRIMIPSAPLARAAKIPIHDDRLTANRSALALEPVEPDRADERVCAFRLSLVVPREQLQRLVAKDDVAANGGVLDEGRVNRLRYLEGTPKDRRGGSIRVGRYCSCEVGLGLHEARACRHVGHVVAALHAGEWRPPGGRSYQPLAEWMPYRARLRIMCVAQPSSGNAIFIRRRASS
jgi:hypothetical protein